MLGFSCLASMKYMSPPSLVSQRPVQNSTAFSALIPARENAEAARVAPEFEAFSATPLDTKPTDTNRYSGYVRPVEAA